MHWNHRVMITNAETDRPSYEIVEAYYNDDGTLRGVTAEGVAPFGETLSELTKDIESMLKALYLPVIDETLIGTKC